MIDFPLRLCKRIDPIRPLRLLLSGTPLGFECKAGADLVRRLREVLRIDAQAKTDGGVRAQFDVVGEGSDAAVVDLAL